MDEHRYLSQAARRCFDALRVNAADDVARQEELAMLGRFFPHELDESGSIPAGDPVALLRSLCDAALVVLDDESLHSAVQSERLDALWCQIAALFPAEVFAGRKSTALLWDGPLAELLAETVDALDDEGRAELGSLAGDADALLAALLRRSRRAQLLLFGV